jgi:hypothetical protein
VRRAPAYRTLREGREVWSPGAVDCTAPSAVPTGVNPPLARRRAVYTWRAAVPHTALLPRRPSAEQSRRLECLVVIASPPAAGVLDTAEGTAEGPLENVRAHATSLSTSCLGLISSHHASVATGRALSPWAPGRRARVAATCKRAERRWRNIRCHPAHLPRPGDGRQRPERDARAASRARVSRHGRRAVQPGARVPPTRELAVRRRTEHGQVPVNKDGRLALGPAGGAPGEWSSSGSALARDMRRAAPPT